MTGNKPEINKIYNMTTMKESNPKQQNQKNQINQWFRQTNPTGKWIQTCKNEHHWLSTSYIKKPMKQPEINRKLTINTIWLQEGQLLGKIHHHSHHTPNRKAKATGKVNTIDNQWLKCQNPWKHRQQTGKTRNPKITKWDLCTNTHQPHNPQEILPTKSINNKHNNTPHPQ